MLLASIRTVTPCLNGSVLEDLRWRRTESLRMRMSSSKRVIDGSNVCFLGVVYSEIRRNPKKAVVMAAQIMILSSNSLDELNRLLFIVLRRVGVMGRRLGME